MADVVEVAQAFETYGFTLDDSEVAAQCLAICRQFQSSADDLAISWDAFYSSNAMKAGLWLSLTHGCRLGYVDHTARHQPARLPVLPARVDATPVPGVTRSCGPYWVSFINWMCFDLANKV
jgi:hypothetical protein